MAGRCAERWLVAGAVLGALLAVLGGILIPVGKTIIRGTVEKVGGSGGVQQTVCVCVCAAERHIPSVPAGGGVRARNHGPPELGVGGGGGVPAVLDPGREEPRGGGEGRGHPGGGGQRTLHLQVGRRLAGR